MMNHWERLEYENIPIYVCPEKPDWFVPNPSADQALSEFRTNGKSSRDIRHLLQRIDGPKDVGYRSRDERLSLETLKECWIHITNRCDMECRHCMFRSSPREQDELPPEDCARIVQEAYELGCQLFFITGGEPLLAKAFYQSIMDILAFPDAHAVILSNLSLLPSKKEFFSQLPRDRVHFQVSIDGLQANHDALRGPGAFRRLTENLRMLGDLGFPATLCMTVTRSSVSEMTGIIDFAASQQISNVHFLWLFQKGNADETLFVEPDVIFQNLIAAERRAETAGVKIDNIEIIRSQVFSSPGTRYDLSNAGWQSLTVGPDGHVYPTPALVYTEGMRCGAFRDGLKSVWEKSNVLRSVRGASLNHSEAYRANPFRYLTGGGDIDHSYHSCGRIAAHDPYADLYTNIAKWLIVHEARQYKTSDYPSFRLKMGEKLGDCPVDGGAIFFTHSNCVLTLPGHDVHTQVNHFYSRAAEIVQEDILNPICYEQSLVEHIPEEMRYRSYGCGSPVLQAGIREGEIIVDLGSGTGIECFIAGKLTGPHGRVVGIDMGDAMLALAEKTKTRVAQNLAYDNIIFKKAFLENLPLDEQSVDLVVSNCVLNLAPDKRRVFQEIFRVLKPGGRLMISDITYDQDIPLEIKYNEKLRGECIGGALRYPDLFGLLNDLGFSQSKIISGYLYRSVQGHDFYSVTYQAFKPDNNQRALLYDFPDFSALMEAVKIQPACACFSAPKTQPVKTVASDEPHRFGCMVCGAELIYPDARRNMTCHYCQRDMTASARCANGHFVCDACHSADALEIIRQVCPNSRDTDAVVLMQKIRSHPRFRIHGPEHHALVPAVILTALKNSGDNITDEQINVGIERGQTIAGGSCAFLGACGAAIGVGIAVSVLTAANPYDGDKRQAAQQATQAALGEIASFNAPRCCQRDSWLALQKASEILREKMRKSLLVKQPLTCEQVSKNKECILNRCPLWPQNHRE